MALDPITTTQNFESAHLLLSIIDKQSQTSVVDAFVDTYDAHAKNGTCSTITVTGAGKSALRTALLSLTGSFASNVDLFAQALSDYWAAEQTPKSPYTIFVSNTASSKIPDFKSAIQTSLTTNVSNASILQFMQNTDAIVNSITYTCKVSSISDPVSDSVV